MNSTVRNLAAASILLAAAACRASTPSATGDVGNPTVLILGGGDSHDFARWFQREDSTTLAVAGTTVVYTDDPGEVQRRLSRAHVLYQAANQPLTDPTVREAILRHVAAGKGLLIGHAGAWYNWSDWPEYNRTLVSGGARAHRRYGEFTVDVIDAAHPVMRGVPGSFTIADELYRFQPDPAGPEIHVVATAREAETGEVYPVVWTVSHPRARILVNTLGHDAGAHTHTAYQAILRNGVRWVSGGN